MIALSLVSAALAASLLITLIVGGQWILDMTENKPSRIPFVAVLTMIGLSILLLISTDEVWKLAKKPTCAELNKP